MLHMGKTNMIDAKHAALAARQYAENLYDDVELRDLRVEEVERSDDGRYWQITLGFSETSVRVLNEAPMLDPFRTSTLEALPRVYKVFKINCETGEVESMKMRD